MTHRTLTSSDLTDFLGRQFKMEAEATIEAPNGRRWTGTIEARRGGLLLRGASPSPGSTVCVRAGVGQLGRVEFFAKVIGDLGSTSRRLCNPTLARLSETRADHRVEPEMTWVTLHLEGRTVDGVVLDIGSRGMRVDLHEDPALPGRPFRATVQGHGYQRELTLRQTRIQRHEGGTIVAFRVVEGDVQCFLRGASSKSG